MNRLVDREFWDARHAAGIGAAVSAAPAPRGGFVRRLFDAARTSLGAEPRTSYAEYLVWQTFRSHLPVRSDWRAIEIGSAPGRNLVRLHRWFNYEPFGVEYSPTGAEQTREALRRSGFDAAHVIEADFFSPDFQQRHRGRFDLVLSRGFIEHFDDPASVVAAHVALLRRGGILVCTVPNLLSAAYPFLALFGRDLLRAHNRRIMRLRRFQALFEGCDLETRHCGYRGLCQFFGVSLRTEDSLRGRLAGAMDRAGDLMNHGMFLLLRGRAVETRWSPHLVYIGQKTR
ncbi:MAG: class I SAM-dependent methyltransferase [Phycisphaerae bacterium]